jgi:hypothetical protein
MPRSVTLSMFMSARVALFDPSNSSITISAISAEPPARTEARQLRRIRMLCSSSQSCRIIFSKYRSASGTVSTKSASTVNRSDSTRFVASRRAPSTVREIKCLAVRRGVGLHQSQNEVAVGSADIDHSPAITYLVDADVAAEMARQGPRDEPIDTLRAAVRSEINAGDRLFVGYSTAVLVQLLVGRAAPDDLRQARDIVAQLEAQLSPVPEPALQLWPLHCRAMLAKAGSDADSDADIVNRYRDQAEELDARGHLAAAKQLAAEPAFGG